MENVARSYLKNVKSCQMNKMSSAGFAVINVAFGSISDVKILDQKIWLTMWIGSAHSVYLQLLT